MDDRARRVPDGDRGTLRVIEGHLDAVEAVVRGLDGMGPVADLLASDAEAIGEMLGRGDGGC